MEMQTYSKLVCTSLPLGELGTDRHVSVANVCGCTNTYLFLMLHMQAPCLTPEWNRTSHGQTVFYTEQRCIPLQGQCRSACLCCPLLRLSDGVFTRSSFFSWAGLNQDLEELMVEGLLLQVSLPEVQRLHQVLLCRASAEQHTDGCASPPQEVESDCDVQYNSQGNNPNQVQTQITQAKVTNTNCRFFFCLFVMCSFFFTFVFRMTSVKLWSAQRRQRRGTWRGKVWAKSTRTKDRR